jgi:FkbM family methyltransferase
MTSRKCVELIASFLPKPLKRAVPGAFKRAVNEFVRRREGRAVKWLQDAADYIAKNFIDELVFCPNGEVYARDAAGPEFLVPIRLANVLRECVQGGTTTWEALESKLLIANLGSDSPVMLDVGANVGLHSIRIAWAKAFVCVYAFEPVAANYQVMRKNITRNHLESRIEPIRAAVGAEDGMVNILTGYGTGNWIDAPYSDKLESVQLVSIDSFLRQRGLQRVDLIKADVEGYELHVLRGAHRCLSDLRPKLLLEIDRTWCARSGYHPSAIFEFLREFNYDYYRITHEQHVLPPSGSLTQDMEGGSNFFFFPRETSFAMK